MTRLHSFLRLSFPVLLTMLLSACSFSLAADVTPPPGANVEAPVAAQPTLPAQLYPLVAPDPADGAAIYAEKCTPCHGDTGLGNGPQANNLPNPPAALASSDLARTARPANWYTTVTQGDLERFMPPFTSLSEQQRWDVVAYLYTLSAPPEVVSQGQEIFQANCARCHGSSGQGDGPDAAGLAAAPTNFTDQSFMAGKSANDLFQAITAGSSSGMPAFAEQLTEDQRWSLTAYLRSLTFSAQQASISQETPAPAATPPSATSTSVLTSTATVVTGTITGQIVNSSGQATPPDQQVILHGFDQMQETLTQTTTISANDTFTFTNVEMPSGRAFIASLDFANVTYTSDVTVVEAGKNTLSLVIPIYASTTDSSAISVDRMHLFFDYAPPDTLRVIELLIISNLGDRTLVAPMDGDPVLTFDLPKDATNLQFQDGTLGGRYVQTATGFGDTAAIPPGSGQHQVIFAFDLPYKGKLDLTQPATLPVNAVVILIPETGFKLSGDQLQDGGSQNVNGTMFHIYDHGGLQAGQSLSLVISGGNTVGGTGLTTGSRNDLAVGLGAFGLVLVVAGVWLYRRTRASAEAAPASSARAAQNPPAEMAPDDAETLMDAILALDDLYQAGGLPEEAYRQRRSELKARLKAVLD
jgi:mono/diheme cytochrome c family protein